MTNHRELETLRAMVVDLAVLPGPMCERFLTDWSLEAQVATSERNRYIAHMVAGGWSLRSLAALTGLSHTAISKIAKKESSPD